MVQLQLLQVEAQEVIHNLWSDNQTNQPTANNLLAGTYT